MSNTEVIALILSSSVLSAIISNLFSIFSNRRKDRVENITKERKVWRDELRKISSKISKCQNDNDLKQAIDKLKVRINPHGLVIKSDSKDCYIWEQIDKFETHVFKTNSTESNIGIEQYKNIFIGFISCLLKDDWERSKREIKSNTLILFFVLTLIASFVIYAFFMCYCNVVIGWISAIIFCVSLVILVCAAYIRIYGNRKNNNMYIKAINFFKDRFREAPNVTNTAKHTAD